MRSPRSILTKHRPHATFGRAMPSNHRTQDWLLSTLFGLTSKENMTVLKNWTFIKGSISHRCILIKNAQQYVFTSWCYRTLPKISLKLSSGVTNVIWSLHPPKPIMYKLLRFLNHTKFKMCFYPLSVKYIYLFFYYFYDIYYYKHFIALPISWLAYTHISCYLFTQYSANDAVFYWLRQVMS